MLELLERIAQMFIPKMETSIHDSGREQEDCEPLEPQED
jgi:hypothetical protein